ncbi:MAG: gamma subclass chorismate mutase AroQ [Planctomycetota bacterium]
MHRWPRSSKRSAFSVWNTLLLALVLMSLISGCLQPVAPEPTAVTPASAAPLSTNLPAPSVPGNVPQSALETHLTEVCRLMVRRLDLMPGVAQAKWNRKLPITDEKREQELLARLAAAGVAQKLPEELTTGFFQAQITASKQVQEQAFQDWTAQQHPPFENPPSLEQDIRPQIDEINGLMLAALVKCRAEHSTADWEAAVQRATTAAFESTSWSEEVVQTATKPLRDLKELF